MTTAAVQEKTQKSNQYQPGCGSELPVAVAQSFMEALAEAPGGTDPTHPRGMLALELGSQLRVAALSGQRTVDLTKAVRDVVALVDSIDELVIDLRDVPG